MRGGSRQPTEGAGDNHAGGEPTTDQGGSRRTTEKVGDDQPREDQSTDREGGETTDLGGQPTSDREKSQ